MNLPRFPVAVVCAIVASLGVTSAATATTPPSPPPVAGGLALPRSVTYAGTEWTIESAAFAPGDVEAAPSIRLDFRVVNRLDDYRITVPAELLAIATPDGSLVRATTLESTSSEYRVELDPGGAAAGTAVFDLVPGADVVDLAAASFVIDEPGRTPAVLPLAGPLPANPYPIIATTAGTSGPIPGTCFEGTVEITATGGTASLDLGAQRADTGRRFLSIDLHIAAVASDVGIACVDGAFLRLVAGTDTLQPLDGTDVSETLDVGSSLDTTVTFAVPVDATTLELGIGADGATIATIPITLPTELVSAPTASTDLPTTLPAAPKSR